MNNEIISRTFSDPRFIGSTNFGFSASAKTLLKNKKLLRQYKDKTYIMSILCYKTESFYTNIHTFFTITLVLTSTIMAISNSYHAHGNTSIKISNIVFNFITILLVSLNTQLKISQRSSEFKLKSQSFNKLTHTIEMLLTNDTIDSIQVQNIISQYDILAENTDSFPGFIKKNVNRKYGDKYTLPTIAISPVKENVKNDELSDDITDGTPPIEFSNIQEKNNSEVYVEVEPDLKDRNLKIEIMDSNFKNEIDIKKSSPTHSYKSV